MNREIAESLAKEAQLLQASRTDVMFHGLSMDPLLQEGDRVRVEPVIAEKIDVGDIITYRHEDKFPTRRVVELKGDYVILCCDNWPRVYFHSPVIEILGRVNERARGNDILDRHSKQWKRRARRALLVYRWEKLTDSYPVILRLLPKRFSREKWVSHQ